MAFFYVVNAMYLLYLDESGSVEDADQKFFVLAGVAVFERDTHWIEQELNKIVGQFAPDAPHELELHGSPMRSGKGRWRSVPKSDRLQAIQDALRVGVAERQRANVRVFGVVVRKAVLAGVDPVEYAFEQLTNRFDLFLKRLHNKHKNTQRGIMLFDESSTERRIQTLAREFKYVGHAWGRTKNYAEVPVFLDSKASRLIQLADLVAFALYRHFEANDSTFYTIIETCFDREGEVEHGLHVRA